MANNQSFTRNVLQSSCSSLLTVGVLALISALIPAGPYKLPIRHLILTAAPIVLLAVLGLRVIGGITAIFAFRIKLEAPPLIKFVMVLCEVLVLAAAVAVWWLAGAKVVYPVASGLATSWISSHP